MYSTHILVKLLLIDNHCYSLLTVMMMMIVYVCVRMCVCVCVSVCFGGVRAYVCVRACVPV